MKVPTTRFTLRFALAVGMIGLVPCTTPAREPGKRPEVKSAPLAPRRPELPTVEAAASSHPVDRLMAAYWSERGVTPGTVVDDGVFARRVFLDCIGLLPTPAELAEFLADARPDKRERLVDALLADRESYAEHWMSFWNDCLRNDYRGTGFIDGGRKQISDWLYCALANNLPYDQFVRELIDPTPESEGFIKGIIWRGVVNASQVPEVQAAQNVSQVFLGINLKCASCHDSFINEWKLVDAYGLASAFAEQPLEMHRCDRPTGEIAPIKFLYPELGAIDPAASRKDRLGQLAKIMTSPENGRLARTIVNRLWARLLGRGLVEPVDEMDNASWNADLLDWLAVDLADHGYDLKHTLRRILTSRAYQLAPTPASEHIAPDFVFSGPAVRRMSGEQFVDAVSAVTGVWQTSPATMLRLPGPSADDAPTGTQADEQHSFLRFSSGVIDTGLLEVDVDVTGARSLWLVVRDGRLGGNSDWADWAEPKLLVDGNSANLTDLNWRTATTGYGQVQINKNAVGNPLRLVGAEVAFGIGTHANSVIVYELPAGSTRFTAKVGPDREAVEQNQGGHEMEFFVLTDVAARAVTSAADPLMVALGRPNREQVLTHRSSFATTLQALELTNGPTLDQVLARGAAGWMAERHESSSELVEAIYLRGLGRRPAQAELTEALDLVGSPASLEGVEDLMWTLFMLPEFQLIF